jgi:arylsulfatase A-like enzyme
MPAREFEGVINLDVRDSVSDWAPYLQPTAPDGAPNVLVILWDDVGYGALDLFGGPIEVPTMNRIADQGVRYTNFHTTALCSPTRSSILNGRNATSNGMASITETADGFPGSSGRIPFENGFQAEVLGEMGWNTYAIGKWHLTPADEVDMSAWRHRWPLGRGFERYYGFLGGETHQYYPDLIYDNHPVEAPYGPEDGYHLSADLVDKAIGFIRDAKAINPKKPWYMYFCPGCAHAPHHVWSEWADKYQGKFDVGYEDIRPMILENQKRLGILPDSVELTSINPHGEPDATSPTGVPWPDLDWVRPWDSLSDDEKRLFVRMAEVYAGYISYTDHEIGRLIEYLEESGQFDNTIIVITSDNGASAEGGPNGSFNENKFFNGVPDTVEANLARIDDLGGPAAYNHYPSGWAWAFDTPFPYWKRNAGYEGGVCDAFSITWVDGIEDRGMRHQYIHAVDIVPTIYELIGVDPPDFVKGYPQRPIEGESFVSSLSDPDAPGRRTQFYAMLGQRAIYHDGWLANTLHPPLSAWGNFDKDEWELYHLAEDRAQSRNVAAEHPEKLSELQGLWFYNAGLYNGMPLDDRSAVEILNREAPKAGVPREHYEYYPNTAEVPESVAVSLIGRSFTIAAGARVESETAGGVLFAHGGVGGGHALYIHESKLVYLYNWLGEKFQYVRSENGVKPGRHAFTAEFTKTGQDEATGSAIGDVKLYIDDTVVGELADVWTQPGSFALAGDGLNVGLDRGSPVSPEYEPPFDFEGGEIDKVVIDVSGEPYVDYELQLRSYLALD